MDSIQHSWHIARLSLLGRPSRTILIGIAVALASTLVVAVSCAMATAMENVQARIHTIVGTTDARIVHRHGAQFDSRAIEAASRLPQVKAAAGRLGGTLALESLAPPPAGSTRKARVTVSCKGTDLASDALFSQVEYIAGRAPVGEGEIGLDPIAAKALAAQPGDRVSVLQFGEPIELLVCGIYSKPLLGALQRPTAHLSRITLAKATQLDDVVSVISLVLDEGVDPKEWAALHGPSVDPPLQLEPAEMVSTGLDRPFNAARLGLALASMLAFLCCSIIVATAMTTALSEQQRTFAMARCIGASRGQLFVGQVIAGCAICLVGGLLGIPLGIALALGAATYFADALPVGLELSLLGIALAISGSLAAGAVGALWPAWRAARLSPLAALAAHASPGTRRGIGIAALVWASCIGIQSLLWVAGGTQARFWSYIVVGLPLLHLGWFLLSVPVMSVLTMSVAPTLERCTRLPKGLLRGSLRAQPWRLGLVGGTLLVGVAIFVASRTSGVAMMDNIQERIRFGDAFAFKTTGFTRAETQRLREIESVERVCAVGYMPLKVLSDARLGLEGLTTPSVVCIGFDSTEFLAMNHLDWIAGDPLEAAARLKGGDAILVAPEFLAARSIGPGALIELGTESDHHPFEVVGVVGCAGLDVATQFFGIRSLYMEHAVSCVFMDFDAVERHFGGREAYLVQMGLPEGATPEDEARISQAVEAAAPGAVFASGRAIRNEVLELGSIILNILTCVAVGALLLASLAGGSVIAAGVASRGRELGILQALGAGKGVIIRLVVAEGVMTGIAGGLVGCGLGLHIAIMEALIYRDLAGLELEPRLAWPVAAAGTLFACMAAVLAALPAARWIARQPVRALVAGQS